MYRMSIEIKWKESIHNKVISTSKYLNLGVDFLPLSYSYYISSYECPICNRAPLYKMRARGSSTIFNGKVYNVFNLFTCPQCQVLLASITETSSFNVTNLPLSQFALVSELFHSQTKYEEIIRYTLNHQNG